ncbi:MAG: DegT/DnrJ/EryC1/StrS family aminotransferase [Candidatus Omnitrophica bacterium]|nr:DegT/DnrJ/EryC1/StrS family aminotransferase [Candidatus Omnitrophota bacterium]
MFYQIAAPYLKSNEKKYVTKALEENWISSKGEYISKFEKCFARYTGARYAVATSSGTTALHLALVSLNIKDGDEVIIPDLTFAATINAVITAGATPVIIDIDRESWCISIDRIKKAVSSRTRAIIPVHLYGQPCNMAAIMDIASKYGLCVIEDCAESLGAEYDGQKAGTFGNVGCFSFYANKIITTGEGGMCVTNDRSIAEELEIRRDHGMRRSKKYWHDRIGYNYRMTNLQAAIGLAQLENIDFLLRGRYDIEKRYVENFSDIRSLEPQRADLENRKRVTWLASFLAVSGMADRDELIKGLYKNGVESRPFFYPLSKMPIYRKYRKYPTLTAYEISERGLNLPTNLNLSVSDYRRIIDIIKKVLKKHCLRGGYRCQHSKRESLV